MTEMFRDHGLKRNRNGTLFRLNAKALKYLKSRPAGMNIRLKEAESKEDTHVPATNCGLEQRYSGAGDITNLREPFVNQP